MSPRPSKRFWINLRRAQHNDNAGKGFLPDRKFVDERIRPSPGLPKNIMEIDERLDPEEVRVHAQAIGKVSAAEGLRVLKLENRPILGRIFYWITRRTLQRFALSMAQFDLLVAREGTAAAANWLLPRFINSLSVEDSDRIPLDGPLVVAANHPGAADVLALMAGVPRRDFRLVVSLPSAKVLTHAMKHVIFVPPKQERQPHQVTSLIIEELRQGNCVLIFPRGNLEPDPVLLDHSAASIGHWSTSLRLFCEQAPDTQIIPAVVGGVFSPQALLTPLARLYRTLKDRQRAALVLQLIVKFARPERWPVAAQVRFGEVVTQAQVGLDGVLPAVREQMLGLFGQVQQITPWPLLNGVGGWFPLETGPVTTSR